MDVVCAGAYYSACVSQGCGTVQECLCGACQQQNGVVEQDKQLYHILEQFPVGLEEGVHCEAAYHHIGSSHLGERQQGEELNALMHLFRHQTITSDTDRPSKLL